jgi:hypothetical protein
MAPIVTGATVLPIDLEVRTVGVGVSLHPEQAAGRKLASNAFFLDFGGIEQSDACSLSLQDSVPQNEAMRR